MTTHVKIWNSKRIGIWDDPRFGCSLNFFKNLAQQTYQNIWWHTIRMLPKLESLSWRRALFCYRIPLYEWVMSARIHMCVYMCVCVWVCVHMCTCTHMYTHTHITYEYTIDYIVIHPQTQAHTQAHTRTHTGTHTHTHTHGPKHACAHTHTHTHVFK